MKYPPTEVEKRLKHDEYLSTFESTASQIIYQLVNCNDLGETAELRKVTVCQHRGMAPSSGCIYIIQQQNQLQKHESFLLQ